MAKAPWFPFYSGDFLASPDVQLMEAHEVGAYILMLAHSWQSDAPGYLPNDEGRLRRVCRLSVAQWADSREMLLSKWPVDELTQMRRNGRLAMEAGKREERVELKAEAGRKSAELRAQRKAEAERLATEAQQNANRNSTDVENSATGVGQNANYSQSQSQSQAKAVEATVANASPLAEPAPVSVPEQPTPKARTRKVVTGDSPAFTAFWQAYPRGDGKQAARQMFARLPEADQTAAAERAAAWATANARQVNDGKAPHAATWLNGRRWEDEGSKPVTPVAAPAYDRAADPNWNRGEGAALRELGFDEDDLTPEARARIENQNRLPAASRQFQTFPR